MKRRGEQGDAVARLAWGSATTRTLGAVDDFVDGRALETTSHHGRAVRVAIAPLRLDSERGAETHRANERDA